MKRKRWRSVRRGLADMEAGRTQDLDEVFDELDARDES
jgi:predicted transcriptional regulator